MLLRSVKGADRETANDGNLQERKSRGEIQLLYTEFHKTAWTQDTTRQILDTTNSGYDKFKLRQECSRAYRDIADANDMLLCV